MGKCRNLDYFYDVVFELDGRHRIMANSAVLLARCEYFRIMFDSKYSFKENNAEESILIRDHGIAHANQDSGDSKVRQVNVRGVPREYFIAIIQYLYTDEFC